MVGSRPNKEELVGSQRQDQFLNLERRKDWEVSMHTMHTSRSRSWGGSHLSYEENTRSIQLEIDHLRRQLCRERRRRTPSDSEPSSDDNKDEDGRYSPKSKMPPSESFLYNEDYHYKKKSKRPSRKGVGNDAKQGF